MMHWFDMGGYALYVWPAYAVFFAVLLWDCFSPGVRRHRLIRQLRGRFKREHARHGKPRLPRGGVTTT